MTNVLVTTAFRDCDKTSVSNLPNLSFTYRKKDEVTAQDLQAADVLVGNFSRSQIETCKHLKWIQLETAGNDKYLWLDPSIVLTNVAGAFGIVIAEHMLGCVLMVQKNLAKYLQLQPTHAWDYLGPVTYLSQLKVLSVGMGSIGSQFLKRMHALGCTVAGVRRTAHEKPDWLDQQVTIDDLDSILGDYDVVALSLPDTPQTEHLFNYERLAKTKKGCLFMNVGRGNAVVTEDLVRLIQEDHFSGVCLDVTEPEPLPKNHPLWNLENVYITPHISGRFAPVKTQEQILDIIVKNLTAYSQNQPLQHVVNKEIGY